MDIKLIFGVLTLHFLALITPGPDFVLAVRNSLQFGRKKGMGTALGFGLGIAVHVSYSIAGIALLLNKFPQIYQVIRYAGAAYLIWLGLSALWGLRLPKKEDNDILLEDRQEQTVQECLRQGFFTNLLNPKATMFILGIFTSLIPPETNLVAMANAGVMMVITTILWFSLVSWLFSTNGIRKGYLRIEKPLNALFAVFFIFVGLGLLL